MEGAALGGGPNDAPRIPGRHGGRPLRLVALPPFRGRPFAAVPGPFAATSRSAGRAV